MSSEFYIAGRVISSEDPDGVDACWYWTGPEHNGLTPSKESAHRTDTYEEMEAALAAESPRWRSHGWRILNSETGIMWEREAKS